MRAAYIIATIALISGSTTAVRADPTDANTERSGTRRWDYSRFSNGPRRVPTPRGASLRRAEALDIGTRAAATRVMRSPLSDELRAAASWRRREVSRLLWPVDEGNYVRGFGYVRTTRPDLLHRGVDISAPEGTMVRAVADGIVVFADNTIRGYGNCLLIAHPNGWVSLYAHNQRITVQPGWRVRRGERVALVGSTGISHGPHVHFELRDNGRVMDPVALFDGGPAFVRRRAERAARAGHVPEPHPLSAEDRERPAPLVEQAAPARRAQAGPTLEIGTRALARRLLRFRPSAALVESVEGRIFSDALMPVRGGSVDRRYRDGRLSIRADEGSAARAAADGLVVYAGELANGGLSVVLLHRNGWVSVHSRLGELDVESGAQVERGAWIGRTAARASRFELRVDGQRVDASEHLRIPST